jgi:ABC-type multidrug transport system ATPase subunit
MSAAIETRALSKRYRRVSALTECTVTVPEGRVSALVGPNGAGKTTLLRLLAGLASPTSGTACVLGGEPRQDPAFLAEIGLNGPVADPAYQAEDVTLEELVLAYMGADEASACRHLTTVGEAS